MIANESSLRVVSSKERKETAKISDDSRFSVIIARAGSSAGPDGPIIFLAASENVESDLLKDLVKM